LNTTILLFALRRRTRKLAGSLLALSLGIGIFSSAHAQTNPAELPARPKAELPARPKTEVDIVPKGFVPWWQPFVFDSLRSEDKPLSIDLDGLIVGAIDNSHQIRVFTDIPLIRETAIQEAWGEFNWRAFMNNRWIDTSDPVGSTLTTGGPDRYRNNQWIGDAGVRRKNTAGGRVELKQMLGFQDTNSLFFVPNPQGASRISLSYTQPLLNGAGRIYNTSLVVLAEIDTSVAGDEMSRQLQSHLLEVTRAYWTLYRERAVLIQRLGLYEDAKKIGDDLDNRKDVDAAQNQMIRTRAALAERRSEIIRQDTAVKNAESRLKSLVNDPKLDLAHAEFVPHYAPSRERIPVSMADSKASAIALRPELQQTMKQIRAASVRVNMAENEWLPVLNLVLETYVAGLQGNTSIGDAWTDQFSRGEPSYTVGIQYERVICNSAAKARLRRRELEVRQLRSQFESAMATLMLEVEVSVREVETAYAEMQAKYRAMEASKAEVEYLVDRWRLLPGENQSAPLYLDNVLQAQVRRNFADTAFADAEVTYNLALLNLKRSEGTLLQAEQITQARFCQQGLPVIHLDRPAKVDPEDLPPAKPE